MSADKSGEEKSFSLYDIFGLDKDASPEDIKKAYRRLSKKFHPDLNKDDLDAEDKFKKLNEAYTILSDPKLREQYDRNGTCNQGQSIDLLSVAIEWVKDLFMTIIDNSPEDGPMIDPFELIRQEIKNRNLSAKKTIKKARRDIKRYTKFKNRLIYKGNKSNQLADLLMVKIAGFENTIRKTELNFQILDLMVDVLEDYDFILDMTDDEAPVPQDKPGSPSKEELNSLVLGKPGEDLDDDDDLDDANDLDDEDDPTMEHPHF